MRGLSGRIADVEIMNVVSAYHTSRTEEADTISIRTADRTGMTDVIGVDQIIRAVDKNTALHSEADAVVGNRDLTGRTRQVNAHSRGVVNVVVSDLAIGAGDINTGAAGVVEGC